MYSAQNGTETGLLLVTASMAAEALALSRLACAEGEALRRSDAPELQQSGGKLLAAVTQAQRELNRHLETALTACGCDPYERGELRLTSRYKEFWWDGSQALPWRRTAQKGAGIWMDAPESIRIFPGRTGCLSVSMTAFAAGPPATVFLRLAGPCQTSDIPLFTLRTHELHRFRQSVRLHTRTQTSVSLGVRGALGICVVRASLTGTFSPLPPDCAGNPPADARASEVPQVAGRQSTEAESGYHRPRCGLSEECRSSGNGE